MPEAILGVIRALERPKFDVRARPEAPLTRGEQPSPVERRQEDWRLHLANSRRRC